MFGKNINSNSMSVFDDNLEAQMTEVIINEILEETAISIHRLINGEESLTERWRLHNKYPDVRCGGRTRAEHSGAFTVISEIWGLVRRFDKALKERSYELTDEEKHLIMDVKDIREKYKDYITHSMCFGTGEALPFERLDKEYGPMQ